MSRATNFRAVAVLLHRDADDPDRVRECAELMLRAADALDAAAARAAATGDAAAAAPAEAPRLIAIRPPPSASAIAHCGRRARR